MAVKALALLAVLLLLSGGAQTDEKEAPNEDALMPPPFRTSESPEEASTLFKEILIESMKEDLLDDKEAPNEFDALSPEETALFKEFILEEFRTEDIIELMKEVQSIEERYGMAFVMAAMENIAEMDAEEQTAYVDKLQRVDEPEVFEEIFRGVGATSWVCCGLQNISRCGRTPDATAVELFGISKVGVGGVVLQDMPDDMVAEFSVEGLTRAWRWEGGNSLEISPDGWGQFRNRRDSNRLVCKRVPPREIAAEAARQMRPPNNGD